MATFIKIAAVTVGAGGAANIEFTSIPSTYTDLLIFYSGRNTSSGDWIHLNFNGSTANFSGRQIFAVPGTIASYTKTDGTEAGVNNSSSTTAGTFGSASFYIPNYTSSSNKSFSIDSVTENNASTAYSVLHAGLWSNTAAITSVRLTPNANNFAQHSTATLYGISKS